jgi:hypothetical protein
MALRHIVRGTEVVEMSVDSLLQEVTRSILLSPLSQYSIVGKSLCHIVSRIDGSKDGSGRSEEKLIYV